MAVWGAPHGELELVEAGGREGLTPRVSTRSHGGHGEARNAEAAANSGVSFN